MVQNLADQFWSKWLKSYLPILQGRQKWFDVCRNLAVGDIVLIVNENCKRGNWPKAIVQEIFRDKEGLEDVLEWEQLVPPLLEMSGNYVL